MNLCRRNGKFTKLSTYSVRSSSHNLAFQDLPEDYEIFFFSTTKT